MLLFSCGFDSANWDGGSIDDLAISAAGSRSIVSGGPHGTGYLAVGSQSNAAHVRFPIPKRTTIRWGFWHYRQWDTGANEEGNDFRLLSAGNLMSFFHLGNAGDIGSHDSEFAFREYDGTYNWTGVIHSTLAWRWLEFEVVISATVGEARIWMGNDLVWEGTGLNTCGPYTAGADEWDFYVWYDWDGRIDDLVIWDDSGSVMNGQNIGAIQIQPTLAEGDGSQTDWAPLGAGTNFSEVDEAIADEDTSYNASSLTNDRDELDIETPPGEGFLGVGIHVQAKRVDAGSGTMKVGIKSSASESTTDVSLSDSPGYRYCSHFTSVDPNTGAAWTSAGAAAAQLLYENAG